MSRNRSTIERLYGKVQVFKAAANSSCFLILYTSFEWLISIVLLTVILFPNNEPPNLDVPQMVHIPRILYSIIRIVQFVHFASSSLKRGDLFLLIYLFVCSFIASFVVGVSILKCFQELMLLLLNSWRNITRYTTLEHTKYQMLIVVYYFSFEWRNIFCRILIHECVGVSKPIESHMHRTHFHANTILSNRKQIENVFVLRRTN